MKWVHLPEQSLQAEEEAECKHPANLRKVRDVCFKSTVSVFFCWWENRAFLSFPCVLGNQPWALCSKSWGRAIRCREWQARMASSFLSFSEEILFQPICGVCKGKSKLSEKAKQNQLLSTPWFYCKIQIVFVLFLLKNIYINLFQSCIAQVNKCGDAGTLILHQCPWRQVSGCSYLLLCSQLLKNLLETHRRTEKLKLCPCLFIARLKWELEENWKRRLLQILYCLKIEGPA